MNKSASTQYTRTTGRFTHVCIQKWVRRTSEDTMYPRESEHGPPPLAAIRRKVIWRVYHWALMGNREFVEDQPSWWENLTSLWSETQTVLESEERKERVRQPHSWEPTLQHAGIVLVAAWQLAAATSGRRSGKWKCAEHSQGCKRTKNLCYSTTFWKWKERLLIARLLNC